MDKSKLRLVTDKELIIFLVVKGFEIRHVNRDLVHDRSLIYFDKSDELEATIVSFTNKDNLISLSDYAAAERRVTTLFHMIKNTAV